MKCIWEHNGNDTLLYSADHIGAFTRGNSLKSAMAKMRTELDAYSSWSGRVIDRGTNIAIIQEKKSNLQIADADSDILFDSEKAPLCAAEYEELKSLALKSARDFHDLYASIPNKNESCLSKRKTFYGDIPRTAQEIYEHTKNVNSYYFAEIDVDADNEGSIYDCRRRGFDQLERIPGFLDNAVIEGSYGELWSLRKVIRRFVWHDRIHAKAMYRMAVKTFGALIPDNTFMFNSDQL